jgi:hypothetical protein
LLIRRAGRGPKKVGKRCAGDNVFSRQWHMMLG